jgi:ATP-dependent protease HslVU (ClpYQ) peptidase subunit
MGPILEQGSTLRGESLTTIVASMKHKLMAADSKCGGEPGIPFRTQKIFRVEEKLIGFAGAAMHAIKFIEWLRHGTPMSLVYDKDECTFDALVMDGGFLLYYDNELVPLIVNEPYYAIGSGAAYAIGAMDAGASPKRAVELAAKRDDNSGLPVITMRHKI